MFYVRWVAEFIIALPPLFPIKGSLKDYHIYNYVTSVKHSYPFR